MLQGGPDCFLVWGPCPEADLKEVEEHSHLIVYCLLERVHADFGPLYIFGLARKVVCARAWSKAHGSPRNLSAREVLVLLGHRTPKKRRSIARFFLICKNRKAPFAGVWWRRPPARAGPLAADFFSSFSDSGRVSFSALSRFGEPLCLLAFPASEGNAVLLQKGTTKMEFVHQHPARRRA